MGLDMTSAGFVYRALERDAQRRQYTTRNPGEGLAEWRLRADRTTRDGIHGTCRPGCWMCCADSKDLYDWDLYNREASLVLADGRPLERSIIIEGQGGPRNIGRALADLKGQDRRVILDRASAPTSLRVSDIHSVPVYIERADETKGWCLSFNALRIAHPEDVNLSTGGYAHWHDFGLTENHVIRLMKELERLQGREQGNA